MSAIIALAVGLVLLAWAADQFVIGAARIAVLRRLPPLVVGAVIIGFGTSTPELLVSTFAAGTGNVGIAVGNIVGSNIANLSLLLGIGAVIVPIVVSSSTVRREAPITVGAMAAFAWLVRGGIGWLEGIALLGGFVVAMAAILRSSAGGGSEDRLGVDAAELVDAPAHRMRVEVIRTSGGLVGTVVGAQVLLWGAVAVAADLGLDEGFVGVTLVAVGTSLPELTTVVQSARRRETDLLVGNLLGSNLFNALAVGGIVGLVSGGAMPGAAAPRAALLAVVVSVVAWIAMRTGRALRRWEGVALVGLYAATIPLMA
jgi:cation:H+ antiporter